jgi:hypothetical protein
LGIRHQALSSNPLGSAPQAGGSSLGMPNHPAEMATRETGGRGG